LETSSLSSLQAKLDEFYVFPCRYVFKFIAPLARIDDMTALFQGRVFFSRYSRKGKYVSFTAEWEVASSEEVISVYRRASAIQGVIAL